MDIIELHSGHTGVLTLSGRLDTSSASELSSRAIALSDPGIRAVLIDLQHVEYLTSAGFRALIAIRQHAEHRSIGLALCGLNGMVQDLFNVSGLLASFHIYPDATSAIAALAKQGST